MIVSNLKQLKNKNYLVTIDGNDYKFDEEIILKYRLVKGKELDEKTLNEAILKNNIAIYYNKALNYAAKYQKGSNEIYDYLKKYELEDKDIYQIIDKLKDIKIINDDKLINDLVSSLVYNGNGINMIKEKLYQKKFNSNLIDEALKQINYEDYYDALNKLAIKAKEKYKKEENEYKKKIKIKNYLLQRGYTYSDIENINKALEK